MLNFFDDLESEYFECYWNLDSYCCDLPGTDDDELDKMYTMMWEDNMFNCCRDAYNCTIAQKYLALTGALESF